MKFEEEFETLIIDPTMEDIQEYRIKFTEGYDKLLYLAQIRGYSDDNDYHTFILFEKAGKIYCFHEFENPQHLSFFNKCEESNELKYFKDLEEYDVLNDFKFFNRARINYNYQQLNSKVVQNKIANNKKNKL